MVQCVKKAPAGRHADCSRGGLARGSSVPIRWEASPDIEDQVCIQRRDKRRRMLTVELLASYGADKRGRLDREALTRVFRQFGESQYQDSAVPSEEDLDFVFFLCDKPNNGWVERRDTAKAVELWLSLVAGRAWIEKLLSRFDFDGDCILEAAELAEVLAQVNDGKAVPPDVLAWVTGMADVAGDGMRTAELVRAVAAWRSNVRAETSSVSAACALM
mmetsp:Transcript_75402/g.243951  ORF Transcript_75402/g.243951 Transcript_75402/m.243951 type:complete len:217 (-) Transcript_75402:70-720(-)